MSQSSDAAEQIVKMSLDGVQVIARITGEGAKEAAVLFYSIVKNNNKTSGKTTLNKMLRSGKELKIFSLKTEDFRKFTEEAKRYGILYCAVINKKAKTNDGIVDIMVRTEDSQKINRIVKRFKLSEYKEAEIRTEIEKTRQERLENLKSNPSLTKMEIENPSSNLLKNKDNFLENSNKESVKEKLNEIKEDLKRKESKILKDKSKRKIKKNEKVK